jgi:uncharacterized membrane protein YidH (DUF202 family)
MGPPTGQPQDRALDWDVGGASERTVLAWERTAVASLALAALVLRAGIVERLLAVAIPVAALLIVAGAAEWLFSRRVYVEHDRPYGHGAVLHGHAIRVLGAVTLIAAVASAALAVAR